MVGRVQQVIAAVLVALGTLWSLQGAGIVHLRPILCFADCAELQDPSGQWVAIGLATIVAGAGLWYLARRRAKRVPK